jgi:hypothetical protein
MLPKIAKIETELTWHKVKDARDSFTIRNDAQKCLSKRTIHVFAQTS